MASVKETSLSPIAYNSSNVSTHICYKKMKKIKKDKHSWYNFGIPGVMAGGRSFRAADGQTWVAPAGGRGSDYEAPSWSLAQGPRMTKATPEPTHSWVEDQIHPACVAPSENMDRCFVCFEKWFQIKILCITYVQTIWVYNRFYFC